MVVHLNFKEAVEAKESDFQECIQNSEECRRILGECCEGPCSKPDACDCEFLVTETGGANVTISSASSGNIRFRTEFEDSKNCGGYNDKKQEGIGEICVYFPGGNIDVSAIGRVEKQNIGYDWLQVKIDTMLGCPDAILWFDVWGAISEGGLCDMETLNVNGSTYVPKGWGIIQVWASTGDELYHVGAYWDATITGAFTVCPSMQVVKNTIKSKKHWVKSALKSCTDRKGNPIAINEKEVLNKANELYGYSNKLILPCPNCPPKKLVKDRKNIRFL